MAGAEDRGGGRSGTRGWGADHNADLLVQSSGQAFRSHPKASRARRLTPSKSPPHERPPPASLCRRRG